MIIAIIGPSGSGKSLTIKHLRKLSVLKRPHLKREDDFFIFNLFKNKSLVKIVESYKRAKLFRHKKERNEQIFKVIDFFYPIVIFVEYLLLYIYYEIFFKEKILICERYAYDYYVTSKNILKNKYPAVTDLLLKCPRPSMVFYLKVTPNTAFKRSKNLVRGKITNCKAFYKRELDEYEKVMREKKAIFISSETPITNVIKEIKNVIATRNKLLNARRIIFIGMDGSGKTTTANNIVEYANQLGLRAIKAHFFHDNILFKFAKYTGLYHVANSLNDLRENQKRIRINPKRGNIWALLHFIDSYIQYIFYEVLYNKYIIIYDRYFYDYLVSFKYHEVSLINLFEKIIPKQQFVFCFMASPYTAYKRKPENYLRYFIWMSKQYKKLSYDHKFIHINSSKISSDGVINLIYRAL